MPASLITLPHLLISTPTIAAKAGSKAATMAGKRLSGQVPADDVRLTANIKEELHLKLKIAAANRRTTVGELIEELVAKHL